MSKVDTTKAGAASLVYSTYLGGSGEDRGFGTPVANGSTSSLTRTAGQPATYNLQVVGWNGITGTFNIGCGFPSNPAPTGTTCSGPATPVNVNTPFTVTANTTARTVAPSNWPRLEQPRSGPGWLLVGAMLCVLVVLLSWRQLKPQLAASVVLMMLLCLLGTVSFDCFGGRGGGGGGGGGGTPAGTYMLTVSATNQGITRTMNLSLTVN